MDGESALAASARPQAVFRNRGFLLETLLALGLATAAFVSGVVLAPSLITATAEAADMTTLVMTSPSDLLVARVQLGIALAWPVGASWIAIVIHRARARRAPSAPVLAVYLVTPLTAVAAGIALSMRALVSLASSSEMRPTFLVTELLPGFWTRRVVILTAVVLWAAAFLLPRRRR